MSHHCRNCRKTQSDKAVLQCKCCKAATYCNKRRQKEHWPEQKVLCNAIKELSSGKSANSGSPNSGHFPTQLTPKQQEKVIGLVGKRCEVKCQLNGKPVCVLWDTGSHVSGLSEEFLAHSFSEAQVRNISELIKGDLSLSAANGSEIPYKGWTQVRFQNKTPQSQDLIVPFLVSPETADYPLLGYNVIEEAVKLDPDVACPELLRESFPTIADDQLESLVNFIKSKHSGTELCSVRSDKNDAVVTKGDKCSNFVSSEPWTY